MSRRVPDHLRDNVVAYIALFFALGSGVGWAAQALPKNSVGTKQLKNGAVTASKLGAGSVTGSKLHAGAVTGRKVANNSLTGQQIDAGTLGKVPNAGHADSATSAGHATSVDSATNAGHASTADTATAAANGAQRFDFAGAASDAAPMPANAPGAHEVLGLDELTVRASCIDAGGQSRLYVTFGTSLSAHLSWYGTRWNNPGMVPVIDSVPGLGATLPNFPVIDITGGNHGESDTVIYRNASRTITVFIRTGAEDGSGTACDIEGTAIAAPS